MSALYGPYHTRWPAKPPPRTRCDGHTGWESDSLGAPTLIRCKAEATETCFVSETMFVETYLCAAHAPMAYRNPRRKVPR